MRMETETLGTGQECQADDIAKSRKLKFLVKWISEIAPKLKKSQTFDEWISGFEDRYGPFNLKIMKETWENSDAQND